jgi:hypothetical protein
MDLRCRTKTASGRGRNQQGNVLNITDSHYVFDLLVVLQRTSSYLVSRVNALFPSAWPEAGFKSRIRSVRSSLAGGFGILTCSYSQCFNESQVASLAGWLLITCQYRVTLAH